MRISDVKFMRQRRFSEVGCFVTIRLRTLTQFLDNRATIMDDSFIKSYIGELLRSLRTQYLIDLIKPYSRLELGFLAKVITYYLRVGYASLTPRCSN